MLSLIVAVDMNGGIGFENQLLTKLPNDMKHFKETTMDKTILMGRKTFESIGKPLDGRFSIVISSNAKELNEQKTTDMVEYFESIDAFLDEYYGFGFDEDDETEIVVCGGSSLYEQLLPHTDKVYITIIMNQFENVDSHFIPMWHEEFEQIDSKYHYKDELNQFDHIISTWVRVKSND